MQLSFTKKKNIRKSFGKLKESLSIPNLIEVQKNSYKELTEFKQDVEQHLVKGFDRVFKSIFPIEDLKLDRIPPLEWKVPHEYPYPEVMWGQKLGIKAERVQNLVSFAREDQVYMPFLYDQTPN